MYGVPDDLDLSGFVDARLDEISLGASVIQFGFQPSGADDQLDALRLSVEGRWELTDATGSVIDHSMPNAEREAFFLYRLLGQNVVATSVDAPSSIALRFDGGEVLRVFDDSDSYESFSIQPGDIFI